MKQSSKKLLALMTAGMLCAGSLGALPAFAETEGESGENDTIETAEAIDVNTEVTGNLSSDNDVDCYRLDLAEDSLWELSFHHKDISDSNVFWKYSIADSEGTVLKTWESRGNEVNLKSNKMGFAKGIYYIIVESDWYSEVNYTLSVNSTTTGAFETENNDSLENASVLPLNTPCTGNLYRDEDIDYYQVNLEEDSLLEISFQHRDISDSNVFWKYSIADSEGTVLKTWESRGSEVNLKTNKMGFAKGTYYIIVEPFWKDSTNYTLTVNSVTTGTFETENNDSLKNASVLPLNTPCTGNLYRDEDVDYYQVNLEEDSLLEINFQHKDNSDSNVFWKYSIADSEGTVLKTWESRGSEVNLKTNKMGFAKDTYYIIVESDWKDDINYTLTVNADTTGTFETEKNDTIETANAISVATDYIGNLYSKNDVDYYTFTLNNTSDVSIKFQHRDISDSNVFWDCTVINENNTEMIKLSSKGSDVNNNSDTVRLSAGTYYVKVNGVWNSDANYTLTVNAKEITYTKGDANADGSIDSTDVFEMMYSCAKKAVGRTDDLLEGANFLAADIDENDTLDSTDIFYEMLYIASKGAGVPVDWDSIVK